MKSLACAPSLALRKINEDWKRRFNPDPEFGKTDIGGTAADRYTGIIYACKYTAGEDGDAIKMYWYGKLRNADGRLRLGLYDDDGAGAHPGTLLDETAEITTTTSLAWYNETIAYSFSAGDFWLAWQVASRHTGYHDAGASEQTIVNLQAYGAFPNPFPYVGHTHENNAFSIYVSYTVPVVFGGGFNPAIPKIVLGV